MDTEDTPSESETPSNDEGTEEENERLQTDDEETEDDPVAEAVRTAVEAQREAIRREAREEAERQYQERLEEDRRQQQTAVQNSRLMNAFGDTVKEIRNGLKKIKVRDAEGKDLDIELDDNFLEEKVIRPLNSFNLTGQQAASMAYGQRLLENALKTIPEAEQEAFIKKAHNKPLDEWLATLAETYAPHSSWAKTLQKDHEAAVAAAEARGVEKGRRSPAGSPKVGESKPGGKSKVDLTTASGLSKALANGDITQDKFRELWPKVTRPTGL